MRGIGWDRAAWGLFLLLAVLIAATFRAYGISWDEPDQASYGHMVVAYYRASDRALFDFKNLYLYGGLFDGVAALLSELKWLPEFAGRHLLNALVGLVGVVGAWRLGRHLAGPRAGFLAALLLAAIPGWYGHQFFNPKDIPFAVAMLWALYFLVRIAGELPRPRWGAVAGFGLCAGLALGTRVGGALLFAYLGLVGVLWLAAQRRAGALRPREAAAAAARVAGAIPLAWLAMLAAWPWAQQAPLARPLEAFHTFSHFPFEILVSVAGNLFLSTGLPRYYLPLFLAVKLPELHLLLSAAAAVWLLRRPARWLPTLEGDWLGWAAVAIALLLPLGYAIATRPVLYDEMRHFLFLLPPIAVVTAAMLDRLCAALTTVRGRRLAGGALALYGAGHLALMVALHPHQYIYYNLLAGGVPGAYGRFDLDYWGNALPAAVEGLKQRLVANEGPAALEHPYRVSTCGPPNVTQHYLPAAWSALEEDDMSGDFLVGVTRFPCLEELPAPLVSIDRLGVRLGYAADLRAIPKEERR